MNFFGRDYQDAELGNVRERIDFIALVYAQSAAAAEKKRDVGAEGGGNFQQTRGC